MCRAVAGSLIMALRRERGPFSAVRDRAKNIKWRVLLRRFLWFVSFFDSHSFKCIPDGMNEWIYFDSKWVCAASWWDRDIQNNSWFGSLPRVLFSVCVFFCCVVATILKSLVFGKRPLQVPIRNCCVPASLVQLISVYGEVGGQTEVPRNETASVSILTLPIIALCL